MPEVMGIQVGPRPDEYGQDYMVKDLICVVEALGGKRPILVGASMGGGVSLIAIGESHLEASALVLVDMAPQMEAEGARRIQAFMNQKPEGFDTLQEVADAIANYQPHRPRPRLLDGLAKNVRLGADGKYHWHWDPARRRCLGRSEGLPGTATRVCEPSQRANAPGPGWPLRRVK